MVVYVPHNRFYDRFVVTNSLKYFYLGLWSVTLFNSGYKLCSTRNTNKNVTSNPVAVYIIVTSILYIIYLQDFVLQFGEAFFQFC